MTCVTVILMFLIASRVAYVGVNKILHDLQLDMQMTNIRIGIELAGRLKQCCTWWLPKTLTQKVIC